jgi:hypothetical protein
MTKQPANLSGLDFNRFPRGKRLTAFHEAGHVIAGLAIGCRVREVRIVGDYIARWSHAPGLPLHQRCGLFLAGWVAECILLNDTSPDDWHWYGAFDRARDGKAGWCDECKTAAAILLKYPEMDTPFLLIQARRYTGMTRLFLSRQWASVERVAHALLSVGVLDHDDCIGLVDEDVLQRVHRKPTDERGQSNARPYRSPQSQPQATARAGRASETKEGRPFGSSRKVCLRGWAKRKASLVTQPFSKVNTHERH